MKQGPRINPRSNKSELPFELRRIASDAARSDTDAIVSAKHPEILKTYGFDLFCAFSWLC
jgi:hypothetical protein